MHTNALISRLFFLEFLSLIHVELLINHIQEKPDKMYIKIFFQRGVRSVLPCLEMRTTMFFFGVV